MAFESPLATDASRASPSPFELTPRSKVKALLASLDDSDHEKDSGSARARLVSAFTKSTDTNDKPMDENGEQLSRSFRPKSITELEKGLDDEDEEDIVRPKGRMAAKMQKTENNSDGYGGTPPHNPHEKVNKLPTTKSKLFGSPISTKTDSDENDLPVMSRKRKVRVARRRTLQSSPEAGPISPGLFVSLVASRSTTPIDNSYDCEELPTISLANDPFKALVEKKRQERLAKQKEVAVEMAMKIAERTRQEDTLEVNDISDDNVERRLTQQVKPTRKASKRALEDIHRETQRMSRNMQLAHNPTTRKKITKDMLFTKFNYKPIGLAKEDPLEPTSSSPEPQSDIETRETPPTSPVSHASDAEKHATFFKKSMVLSKTEEGDNEANLPDLQDALGRLSSPHLRNLDKGKGKAVEETSRKPPMPLFKQRPIRVRPPGVVDGKVSGLNDSDSDLEVVTAKFSSAKSKKLDSIFDRGPVKQAMESNSLHALRMLAHLTSPGKKSIRKDKISSMTTSELQVSLQQRARQQAAREREERLQVLRDKGVIVQTAEEREKEIAEVEDLISKARREGEEIMKREMDAAKKERKANGEVDPLGDSSDDEDWEKERESIAEELSGSEMDSDEGSGNDGLETSSDEEEGEDTDEGNGMALDGTRPAERTTSNLMFDEAELKAELSMDEETNLADADHDEMEEEDEKLPIQHQRRSRKINIISDDEDEEVLVKETPSATRTKAVDQAHTDSAGAPNSVLRSATKTFIPGLTVAGPAGLGLTQIFAGTMDESQMNTSPTTADSESNEYNSLAFLRQRPMPELPDFVPTIVDDTQDVVMDSQPVLAHIPESQADQSLNQAIQLQFSQSQIHGFDSLVQDPMGTQLSEMPEATQDAGFQHMTPIRGRFIEAPPSTIDTPALNPTRGSKLVEESPIVKKKGKLRRRAPEIASFSDDEDLAKHDEAEIEAEGFNVTANVFDVMRKASKKSGMVVDEFDKKKSGAKEMVHEQADESEDEYAGLGGASDESSGEEDAYVKEIIDDEGGKDVDKHKLAAFFADRERANDEKQVEKLYNDITKGMLRRKRGADYDLSDSDDDGEARRRMKRKEFAKMRKALLVDERIGKIAQNPKQQAFLRAIEDRESDDEIGFLDDFAEQDENIDSQSQSQNEEQRVPDSQPEGMGPPKRKRSADIAEAKNRLPPHLRRSKATQKPSNLSEIRESLSSLIEYPTAMITPTESGSESEGELEIEGEPKDKENRDPFYLRRAKVPTIDRIALKRASSSSTSASTRLAFASSSSTLGLKVPPLLRRATTNSSLASTSSSTNSSVNGGISAMERMTGGIAEGIKRGGGKNSGVHYFARESERRAVVDKTEKRREQKRSKGAQVRRKAAGGLFGGGKFE